MVIKLIDFIRHWSLKMIIKYGFQSFFIWLYLQVAVVEFFDDQLAGEVRISSSALLETVQQVGRRALHHQPDPANPAEKKTQKCFNWNLILKNVFEIFNIFELWSVRIPGYNKTKPT